MDLGQVHARDAEISAQVSALYDERDRIWDAVRRDGKVRAMKAMIGAGFSCGESIIADRRWGHRIGVLIKLEVRPPWKPGKEWIIDVRFRSILKSGRLGKKIDYQSYWCAEPEDLPSKLEIVGNTDRNKALDHPRIIRLDSRRKSA